jgi:hypothetical protein
MLAKVSLGQSVPPAAVTYTRSLQAVDGSWEYCCGFGGDTNATGLVIRALIAAGVPSNDSDIVDGMAYLHASQQLDGGIPYIAPGSSDPNSTAFVGRSAVGDPMPADRGGPVTPFVRSTQNTGTGALQYFGFDNLYATVQGVPGLMLAAYPEQVVYVDSDGDGVLDTGDNCTLRVNAGQVNTDGNNALLGRAGQDVLGDACDADIDGDGHTDARGGRSTCADVDGDHAVSIWICRRLRRILRRNPAPERRNQDGDQTISILDLAKQAAGSPIQFVSIVRRRRTGGDR